MRRPSPVIAVGALALIVGGVAVAAPGDGPTIYACAENVRGTVRVVDQGVACEAGETPISWNKQGPTGPAGAAGRSVTLKRSPAVEATIERADRSFAKRPKKPPKKLIAKLKAVDPAPGEARAAYRDGPVQLESVFAAALTGKAIPMPIVATLPLPAGRWVINAKANADLEYDVHQAVIAAGATYDSVACELHAGADEDSASADGFSSVLALQVVHRYAGPGLVQLQCYGFLEPRLSNIKVTAVRVAKLKNQSVGG